MKKYLNCSVMLIIAILSLNGCSNNQTPRKASNSAEVQKANAQKAQRELSSETAR